MAAWPTQLVMDWAVTPNSRESCEGERPARTSSTICWRNSAGYGGRTFDICDSLNTKNDVSTEPGQLQTADLREANAKAKVLHAEWDARFQALRTGKPRPIDIPVLKRRLFEQWQRAIASLDDAYSRVPGIRC